MTIVLDSWAVLRYLEDEGTAAVEVAELWTGDPELLIDDAPWKWKDLRSEAAGPSTLG